MQFSKSLPVCLCINIWCNIIQDTFIKIVKNWKNWLLYYQSFSFNIVTIYVWSSTWKLNLKYADIYGMFNSYCNLPLRIFCLS